MHHADRHAGLLVVIRYCHDPRLSQPVIIPFGWVYLTPACGAEDVKAAINRAKDRCLISRQYTMALQVCKLRLLFEAACWGGRRNGGVNSPAGNVRKLPAVATRKWARQVRWQERASQCADEAPAAGKGPDSKGRHGLNPNLVAAMQRAERTDR